MASEEQGDRYVLGELLALYRLEPTLRDVYVEGSRDVAFYSWYIDEHGLSAQVFDVDERVTIDREVVAKVGQEINSRGRAIALAIYSQRALGIHQSCVTVVVDSDMARVVGPMPIENSCLLMTDVPAVENYVLFSRPLTKLFKLSLGIDDLDGATVLSALIPVLQAIQAVRILLQGFRIGLVSGFVATCTFNQDHCQVDKRELINRSLTGITRAEWPGELGDLVDWAGEYFDLVVASGQTGRGHDIVPLLFGYLRSQGYGITKQPLEAALMSCLEASDLDDKLLFISLRSRITTP
jgi:hypothetical protein